VNYAEFIAALQTTKAGLPVQQRQHFRHSSPSKVPSIPCPSDAEIIGVQGYKRPIRQARAVSEHMATLLDEPPETADSRFLEWAQYKCIANIAPVLVADPLKEQLKNLATTYGYGTSQNVATLLKLYEQKSGSRGVLSFSGFCSICKRHGVNSEEFLSRLFALHSKDKVIDFEGLVAALSTFTVHDKELECKALYKLCSLSSGGREITKSGLLRFLVAANTEIGADKNSFEARVSYQKMERISNSLFIALDADGGGSLDEEEFVDGLLASESLWSKFNSVNPIQKYKGNFQHLNSLDE